ncbi:hypothetical protein VPH35_092836 [Triticum aestivum]
MVCPCALLIVMAKLSLIGNCFLLNLKGNISSSDGQRGIRGRNTLLPACCPSTISASMAFLWKPRTTSLVPLHNPLAGSMFLNSITGQFNFSLSACGGSLLGVRLFRNSGA